MCAKQRIAVLLISLLSVSLPAGSFDMSKLENLGEVINQQVQDSLKPVRALQSVQTVTHGSDGTTIATFSPSGRKFILRDSSLYECTGTISYNDGSCSGNLKKFTFNDKKDYCFTTPNTIMNNWYCFSSSGIISSGSSNGQVYCNSNDGRPTLLISVSEYKDLCRNVANTASYKYFTYHNLEDFGSGLSCSGDNPQVCTYSTSL